jgi:hypothetical protein
MSEEFLYVDFAETRRVLANGRDVGETNTTLMLQSNQYIVKLSGTGFDPASQKIVLSGTTEDDPYTVKFKPASSPGPGV